MNAGHENGGGNAFAGDVTERERKGTVLKRQQIIVIAADRAGRAAESAVFDAGGFAVNGRQKAHLHVAGDIQFMAQEASHLGFAAQAFGLNSGSGVSAHQAQQLGVLFAEAAGLVEDLQGADHFVVGAEGNAKNGFGFVAARLIHLAMEARIVAEIVGDDDLILGDASANQAAGFRNADFADAIGHASPEFAFGVVNKPDAGAIAIDEIARQGGIQTDQRGDVLLLTDAGRVLKNDARDVSVYASAFREVFDSLTPISSLVPEALNDRPIVGVEADPADGEKG